MPQIINKAVIITGGGGGIGRTIATRLCAEGYKVGIFDVNLGDAEKTAYICAWNLSRRAWAFEVDICNHAQSNRALDQFEKEVGPCTLLVNVLHWGHSEQDTKTDYEPWNRIVRNNLFGPLNMHLIVGQRFLQREFGRIVNVSATEASCSDHTIYAACRSAISSFTSSMIENLSVSKIALNSIHVNLGNHSHVELTSSTASGLPPLLEDFVQRGDYPGATAFFLSDEAADIAGKKISIPTPHIGNIP